MRCAGNTGHEHVAGSAPGARPRCARISVQRCHAHADLDDEAKPSSSAAWSVVQRKRRRRSSTCNDRANTAVHSFAGVAAPGVQRRPIGRRRRRVRRDPQRIGTHAPRDARARARSSRSKISMWVTHPCAWTKSCRYSLSNSAPSGTCRSGGPRSDRACRAHAGQKLIPLGRGRELPARVEARDEGVCTVEPSDASATMVFVGEVLGAPGADARPAARAPGERPRRRRARSSPRRLVRSRPSARGLARFAALVVRAEQDGRRP